MDDLIYIFVGLVSDVNILTRMNQASSERYMELTTNTNDMTRKLIDVNNRCKFDTIIDVKIVVWFIISNLFVNQRKI